MPSTRNNRINIADFLNRSCTFDARFESILLGATPQNPFSTVSVKNGCGGRSTGTSVVPRIADDFGARRKSAAVAKSRLAHGGNPS
jgi:hypothetical protein